MDIRRHAPLAQRRRTAVSGGVRGVRTGSTRNRRQSHAGVYARDHAAEHGGGRFRWMISTILAAGVGALVILVAIAGSVDNRESPGGLLSNVPKATEAPLSTFKLPTRRDGGLNWALPKSDRLISMASALASKMIIHDSMRRRIDNREKIVNKAYVRAVARLAPISAREAEALPPFNPYKLYASPGRNPAGGAAGGDDTQDVQVKVVELLGGILAGEDGQELQTQEVAEIVQRARDSGEADPAAAIRGAFNPEGADKPDRRSPQDLLADRSQRGLPDVLPPNTTALAKSVIEGDDADDDLEAREVRVIKAQKGETLTRILSRLGGEGWQVRAMVEAARPVFADNGLVAGNEIHVTLVPSVTRANRLEPVRVSVFGEGHDHKVTVARNAGGEFAASTSPVDERIVRAALSNEDLAQSSSIYASLYHSALQLGLSADTIQQILRIHAYETDFRRKVRGGDAVEFFFDVKDEERGSDGALGDLLATTITTAGEGQRFYRFRNSDGSVDYYDESGSTSRKFLMRQPVRGEGMRFTSGFGMRRHPTLGYVRMHAGVDWAGPIGTPIMAAGAGTIEEAGRKGEYGNYIRIRHANGYKTTYAHMLRLASGVSEGVRVSHGQIIGYLGNTGVSSGPHLHFEVLVNNQHVDPMSIQVPKDRKLAGKALQDFQKERLRIDELMRRSPVKVSEVQAQR
jgi:murein DD-endopeptidase MepM/ murein hydrolase activator NlpD